MSQQDKNAPTVEVEAAPEVEETKEPKVKGVTTPEFDGVGIGTLRAWHRYWSNPNRCKDDPAITEERPVEVHLAMIAAEAEARGKTL